MPPPSDASTDARPASDDFARPDAGTNDEAAPNVAAPDAAAPEDGEGSSPGLVGGKAAALLFVLYFVCNGLAAVALLGLDALLGDALPQAVVLGGALVVGNLLATWAGLAMARRPRARMLPWRGVPAWLWPTVALMLVGLWPLVFAGVHVLTQVWPISDAFLEAFAPFEAAPVIGLLVIGILAPITEELLFRGVLLGALLERYAAKWAVPVSAVLFAVAHLSQQVVTALMLGLVLGWLRVRTRSLAPAIALHVVNNSVFFGLALFAEDWLVSIGLDPDATTPGLPPVWAIAGGAVLLAAAVAAAYRGLPLPDERPPYDPAEA